MSASYSSRSLHSHGANERALRQSHLQRRVAQHLSSTALQGPITPSVAHCDQWTASHTAYWGPEHSNFHSFWPICRFTISGDQSPGPTFMAILLSMLAAYTSEDAFWITTCTATSTRKPAIPFQGYVASFQENIDYPFPQQSREG